MAHDHGSDKRAAFTGLILGAIAIFIIVFAVSKWTSSRFEGHANTAKAEAHK